MTVDVKVTENLDRLVFCPRSTSDESVVKQLLRQSNHGLSFGIGGGGIAIKEQDVPSLNISDLESHLKWSELAQQFYSNRKDLAARWSETLAAINVIRSGGEATALTSLNDIDGLTVLDKHQLINVACMTVPNGFGLCVFDEQGAGKTVTLIFAFDVLVERNEVDFALIIAPKSMVSEWPQDFGRFMPQRYSVKTLIGSRDQKMATLHSGADVLVTNFETAISMEHELRALLRQYGSRSIIVVDESFFAKNIDAKRTMSIRRLREFTGRSYVLCGTPAPNAPEDLIQQFNIVDYGCTFSGIDLPRDKEDRAEVVRSTIEGGIFVRNLKVDVLPNLPAKHFNKVSVPLQPVQKRLYEENLESLVTDLTNLDESTFQRNRMSFLARRMKLLQICSNPLSVINEYSETPAKALALDEILADLIDRKKEKVIIWSFFTASLAFMFQRYSRYNPVRYDGTVGDISLRREAVRSFREDKGIMLFIANPAAAGAGLNLQSSRFAIYESMSNQAAHYLQSLDRIHRRGQEKSVEYYMLLCEDTIEIKEYERLVEKEKKAQIILGDPDTEPYTKELFLAELLSGFKNNPTAL